MKKNTFKKYYGFTLVELLITIVVIAILFTVAAPSISQFYSRALLNTATADLQHAIELGKSAAVKYQQIVTMSPSKKQISDDTNNGNNWQHSYILFVDRNGNGKYENDEVIITTEDFKVDIYFSGFPANNYLQFNPTGTTSNGTFTLTSKKISKNLVINNAGRVRHG